MFKLGSRCWLFASVSTRTYFYQISHQASTFQAQHLSLSDQEQHQVERLYKGLIKGDRACLAQAITLVETTHPRKRLQARLLLNKTLKDAQISEGSFRIGLSGPPGAGKSTFLENFGRHLTSLGKKIAVLTVDPSSSTTGGSLLGDKTRMQELSRDPSAFIRPSPSKCHLGGVTQSTGEAMLLCEASGYDTVFVETVGVGQSEFAAADMVDLFVVVIPPAGGDELQGLKRGIMEHSHIVVVNKADGDLIEAAVRIQYEYTSALKFMRPISPNWRPRVCRVSSLTREGLPELWTLMCEFRKVMVDTGELVETRKKQRRIAMWNNITYHILQVFREDDRVKVHIKELERQVEEGLITAGQAAETLLDCFVAGRSAL